MSQRQGATIAHVESFIADLSRMESQARSDGNPFLAYLFEMAANECRNLLRNTPHLSVVRNDEPHEGQDAQWPGIRVPPP